MALFLGLTPAVNAETLKLSVETTAATGTLRAAVYSSTEAFEQGNVIAAANAPAKAGTTELEIKNLEPGAYGIALFHDLNENEELDRNLFGAPSEPFGFSNNPVIKFSAPNFDAFKFEFDGNPMEFNIVLNGG